MGKNGGVRKGAGRKKGGKNQRTLEVITLLDQCVDFKELIYKLVELVEGIDVEESIGKEKIIYTKPPDSYAAKLLLEYRFGKPKQSNEITGKDGKDLFPKLISKVNSEEEKKLLDGE